MTTNRGTKTNTTTTFMKQAAPNTRPRPTAPMIIAGVLSLASLPTLAQTYTVVDLTPSAGNAVATALAGDLVAGYAGPVIYGASTRATAWDGTSTSDLHPSHLADDPTTGAAGRSALTGGADGILVGWAAGVPTGGRPVPVMWNGAADTAVTLPIPFTNFGGQALATDGRQVVGYGTGLDRDGTVQGPAQAVVWDAITGAAVNLGDGGNHSIAYGTGGGVQVGVLTKGTATAVLWRGDRRTQVSLHPRGAVVSVASATDGARQVGYAGFDIRVRAEAAKGAKEQRFNYAHVWSGSAASGLNIHPYPANPIAGANLTQSWALGVNGSWIVGYAGDATKSGTPAFSHAIVWDADFQSVDLNAFLPAGFVGAQALSVAADGTVSGFIAKADGTRHAAVWIRNANP